MRYSAIFLAILGICRAGRADFCYSVQDTSCGATSQCGAYVFTAEATVTACLTCAVACGAGSNCTDCRAEVTVVEQETGNTVGLCSTQGQEYCECTKDRGCTVRLIEGYHYTITACLLPCFGNDRSECAGCMAKGQVKYPAWAPCYEP